MPLLHHWLSAVGSVHAHAGQRNATASAHRQLEGCSGDTLCEITFESHNGLLHANGQPFYIKGVNW